MSPAEEGSKAVPPEETVAASLRRKMASVRCFQLEGREERGEEGERVEEEEGVVWMLKGRVVVDEREVLPAGGRKEEGEEEGVVWNCGCLRQGDD